MKAFILVAATVASSSIAFAAEEPTNIYKNSKDKALSNWTDYLVDSAAGNVSAASLLGITGDVVAPVENVRDLVTSLKGLSSDGAKATLAISITPGRTELAPIAQQWYYDSRFARLLANTTIGYAQGDADIGDAAFERRAVSIETGLIFDRNSDPVIALGDALAGKKGKCDLENNLTAAAARKEARAKQKAAFDARIEELKKELDNTFEEKVTLGSDDIGKAEELAVNECFDATLEDLRWNASRFSLMYGTGWIKPNSGDGDQQTLGHTGVLSITYGFEKLGKLAKVLALTGIYRYTENEPVLETLGTDTVKKKDSSLVVGRLQGGTKKIRGLIEISNARSSDITASQRAFRQAVGLDFRVYEATWVNLRFGRQRTIDGSKNEVGSLLTVSYSPSSLID